MNEKYEQITLSLPFDDVRYPLYIISLAISFSFLFIFSSPLIVFLKQSGNIYLDYISNFIPFIIFLLSYSTFYVWSLKKDFKSMISPFKTWDSKLFIIISISFMILLIIGTVFEGSEYEIQGFTPLLFLSIPLIIIQSFTEELIFRLIPLIIVSRKKYLKKINIVFTVLLSSILFSLAHALNTEPLTNSYHIYYFLMAVFLIIMTLYTKGIETAFSIHLFNNLFITCAVGYRTSSLKPTAFFMSTGFPKFENLILFELISVTILSLIVFYYIKGISNGKKK